MRARTKPPHETAPVSRRIPRVALFACCAASVLVIAFLSVLSALAIGSLQSASVVGAASVSIAERAGEITVSATDLTWRWESKIFALVLLA